MDYVIAFIVGGFLCLVAQLIFEYTKLTMGQICVLYTVIGAVLSGFGIYEWLLAKAGGGALIPVMGFGHSIMQGAFVEAQRLGWVGLFTGAFEYTSLGLACAIIFGSLFALIFDPKV